MTPEVKIFLLMVAFLQISDSSSSVASPTDEACFPNEEIGGMVEDAVKYLNILELEDEYVTYRYVAIASLCDLNYTETETKKVVPFCVVANSRKRPKEPPKPKTVQENCRTLVRLLSSVTCLEHGGFTPLEVAKDYEFHALADKMVEVTSKIRSGVDRCKPPSPLVKNGVLAGPDREFWCVGVKRRFICNPGYEVQGESVAECDATGNWTFKGYCQVACPRPPKIKNARLISPLKTTGRLDFACNFGYMLRGKNIADCVTPGTWRIRGYCSNKLTANEIRMLEAAKIGYFDRVREFLQLGILDVNWRSGDHSSVDCGLPSNKSVHNATLLIFVTCLNVRNLHEIVRLLVDNGGDVNAAESESGYTPLMFAVEHGQFKTVKCLAERGANVNAKANKDGWTAMRSAVAFHGNLKAIQLLLDLGADLTASVAGSSADTSLDFSTCHRLFPLLLGNGSLSNN